MFKKNVFFFLYLWNLSVVATLLLVELKMFNYSNKLDQLISDSKKKIEEQHHLYNNELGRYKNSIDLNFLREFAITRGMIEYDPIN
ncbi:MAG: hypothetical protein NZT61_06590 [Deltaproteobacteria bacterium]|nr:hypothetical protein [Deltaproteobacteria bacterium]